MKKFLTTATVALLAIVLGQNIAHAGSIDSLTWTWDNATQGPTSDYGEVEESTHFKHYNEWIYVDITNPSETEKAPLNFFGADVKDGIDDGFNYTVDTEKKLITGIEDYNIRWSRHYVGQYYAEFSGHDYLAPGETAHFKLKVAATSGKYDFTATPVRGVYYAFNDCEHNIDGDYVLLKDDHTNWQHVNFKLNVHFWTQNEGWSGTFDARG